MRRRGVAGEGVLLPNHTPSLWGLPGGSGLAITFCRASSRWLSSTVVPHSSFMRRRAAAEEGAQSIGIMFFWWWTK